MIEAVYGFDLTLYRLCRRVGMGVGQLSALECY